MTDSIVNEIERRAYETLGKPWIAMGHTRGYDCLGVVIHAFSLKPDDADFASAQLANYPACATVPPQEAAVALESFLTKHLVETTFPVRGACLAFSFKSKGGWIDHLGVLTRRGLVHATRNRGVLLSEYNDSFSRRLVKVFVAP